MKFLDDIGLSHLIIKIQGLLDAKADKVELHNHTNKIILDKFTEVSGKPSYAGQPIGGISTIATVSGKVILSIASNKVTVPIANFNKDRDALMVYRNSVYEDGYTISANGKELIKTSGTWEEGTIFNFVAWQPLALDGVEGVVLEQEKTVIGKVKPTDATMWYQEL